MSVKRRSGEIITSLHEIKHGSFEQFSLFTCQSTKGDITVFLCSLYKSSVLFGLIVQDEMFVSSRYHEKMLNILSLYAKTLLWKCSLIFAAVIKVRIFWENIQIWIWWRKEVCLSLKTKLEKWWKCQKTNIIL